MLCKKISNFHSKVFSSFVQLFSKQRLHFMEVYSLVARNLHRVYFNFFKSSEISSQTLLSENVNSFKFHSTSNKFRIAFEGGGRGGRKKTFQIVRGEFPGRGWFENIMNLHIFSINLISF